MKNLSIQEQKQIVGGAYYYKIFDMNGNYRGKSFDYDDMDTCINACIQMVGSFERDGERVVGRVYDARTGQIIFRW